jgi:hypothetical protein
MIRKRSEDELKELWSSMFRVSSFSGLNENDNEVLGILMLLQTAVTNVRRKFVDIFFSQEVTEIVIYVSVQSLLPQSKYMLPKE